MDDKKAKQHAYYLAHPEIWQRLNNQQRQRYASDPDYRRRRQAQQRRYEKANPEKLRAKNKRVKQNRRSQPWGKLDYIIRNTRGRAVKRGIPFDDELLKMALDPPTHCPCCGCELEYRNGIGQSPQAPSFDRVVPSKGYIVGNVNIICMRCNATKNDGSAEDHRRIAEYIDRCTKTTPPPV